MQISFLKENNWQLPGGSFWGLYEKKKVLLNKIIPGKLVSKIFIVNPSEVVFSQ